MKNLRINSHNAKFKKTKTCTLIKVFSFSCCSAHEPSLSSDSFTTSRSPYEARRPIRITAASPQNINPSTSHLQDFLPASAINQNWTSPAEPHRDKWITAEGEFPTSLRVNTAPGGGEWARKGRWGSRRPVRPSGGGSAEDYGGDDW